MSLVGVSLVVVLTPFSRDVRLLYALGAAFGAFEAASDVTQSAWLLEIWPQDCFPHMLVSSLLYSVGAATAPLIVSPFLTRLPEGNITTENFSTSDSFSIEVPFTLTAILLLFSASCLTVLIQVHPYSRQHSKMSRCDGKSADKPKCYYLLNILVASVLSCSYYGMAVNYFTFFPKYIMNLDLEVSQSRAALMQGMGLVISCFGFLIGILMSTKICPLNVLWIRFVFIGVSQAILIFALDSEVLIWISLVFYGFGDAGIWATILAFTESKMNVTPLISGTLGLASTLSSVSNTILVARFLKKQPTIYPLINMISLLVSFFALIAFHAIDLWFTRVRIRFQKQSDKKQYE